jgi:hypothetical protein
MSQPLAEATLTERSLALTLGPVFVHPAVA